MSECFLEGFDTLEGELSEGRIQLSGKLSPLLIDANFRNLRRFLQFSEAKF